MFNLISASDLQKKDLLPKKFIIDDLLPTGLSMLAAPPKYYKSFLVHDMLLAITSGEKFWGRKTCKGPCLYLALEDTYTRLKARQDLLTDNPIPDNFYYSTTAPTLDDDLCGYLEDWILGKMGEGEWPSIIVIDTFQKIRGASSFNISYGNDYKDIGLLKALTDRWNVSILLIHHLRKMNDEEDPFNNISGSNGLLGALDACYVMKRRNRMSEDTVFSMTGRDIETKEYVIRFNVDTYRFEFIDSEEIVKEKELKADFYKSDIVAYIKHRVDAVETTAPIALTATEILEGTAEYRGREPFVASNKLKRLLFKFASLFRSEYGIEYTTKMSNGDRLNIFAKSESSSGWSDKSDTYEHGEIGIRE